MGQNLFDHPKENFLGIQNQRKIYTGYFKSSRGNERIYYKRSFPQTDLLDKIIHLFILHDAGDYHGRYKFLPEFLSHKMGERIVFTFIDLKGHGLSSGTRGHLDDFDEYCEDLEYLMNMTPRLESRISNIILGNGMGSLLALRYFQEYAHKVSSELSGLILSNPLLSFRLIFLNGGDF